MSSEEWYRLDGDLSFINKNTDSNVGFCILLVIVFPSLSNLWVNPHSRCTTRNGSYLGKMYCLVFLTNCKIEIGRGSNPRPIAIFQTFGITQVTALLRSWDRSVLKSLKERIKSELLDYISFSYAHSGPPHLREQLYRAGWSII